MNCSRVSPFSPPPLLYPAADDASVSAFAVDNPARILLILHRRADIYPIRGLIDSSEVILVAISIADDHTTERTILSELFQTHGDSLRRAFLFSVQSDADKFKKDASARLPDAVRFIVGGRIGKWQ